MSTEENVRPEVRELIARGNITLEEYKAFRGNSWEFEAITPALSDEALAFRVKHTADNCFVRTRRPATTYTESLINSLVPELLRRLAEKAQS